MTEVVQRRCLDCGRPIAWWYEQRPGALQTRGRGLCDRDRDRRTRAGTLGDRPTRLQRWSEVADDYAMLRGEGYPRDVIAARLGMTWDALDQALTRHRDDPRARRPATRKAG